MTPAYSTHSPYPKHRRLDPERLERPLKLVPIPDDDRQQPIGQNRRLAAAVALSCDWMEAAILASLSWLSSFILTGLVHCAFAYHVGDPDLLQRLHDTGTRTPPIRSSRAPALEVRP